MTDALLQFLLEEVAMDGDAGEHTLPVSLSRLGQSSLATRRCTRAIVLRVTGDEAGAEETATSSHQLVQGRAPFGAPTLRLHPPATPSCTALVAPQRVVVGA